MGIRGAAAAVSLAWCAMFGCASPLDGEADREEPPVADEPLDVSVESIDVLHHALRISATMVDGGADVSVRLGGRCAHREIGGGTSTRSTFVWRLGEADLAGVIECGLLVVALVRDGGRILKKTAELEVAAELRPESDSTEAQDDGEEEANPDVGSAATTVPIEIAQSLLGRRPLVIGGTPFIVWLSVGGTSMGTESEVTG
jgi:hypothetical protein